MYTDIMIDVYAYNMHVTFIGNKMYEASTSMIPVHEKVNSFICIIKMVTSKFF